jgi:hypothetical protein
MIAIVDLMRCRSYKNGESVVLGSARLWRAGDRILRSRTFATLSLTSDKVERKDLFRQNAETSTLQACAPQIFVNTLNG